MYWITEAKALLKSNEDTIKTLFWVLSTGFSVATFVLTRWVQRRMRREAQERHEEASRFGHFSLELSTIKDGVLKNDVLAQVPGAELVADALLFSKVMATPNRDVIDPDPEIGNIGLLQLEREKDTKALLLACAVKIGEPFAAERFKARLSTKCVEITMVISFRHDTYKPKDPADGHRISRAPMVPLKLLKRIGTNAEFAGSVKTEGGKSYQLDRLRHMSQMWEALNSEDPGIRATVWQFTLAFPVESFPSGLIEWMD